MRTRQASRQLLVSLLLLLRLLSAAIATSASVPGSVARCTWIELSVDAATGPAPQGVCDQSAVYDAAGQRLLVAAGELSDNTDSISGVWALDFSSSFSSPSWLNLTQLQPDLPAPSPRSGLPAALQSAASAASGSSFLLVGGFDLTLQIFDNETWDAAVGSAQSGAVDTFTWLRLPTAAAGADGLPGLAWGDCAWADEAQQRLLMYGGTSGVTGRDSGDLWLLDLSLSEPRWENITAASSGARPPPLSGLRLQRDSARSQLVLFGGYGCTEQFASGGGGIGCFTNAVWTLSLNASSLYQWSLAFDPAAQPDSPAPSPRAWHSTALLQDQLWLFGGNYVDNSEDYFYYNDVWLWELEQRVWLQPAVLGSSPPVMWSQTGTLVWSPEDGLPHLLVVGGCTSSLYYSSVFALKLNAAISADNCDAFGSGLQIATAGQAASFLIQTRNSSRVLDAATNSSSLVFGSALSWGVGLQFSVIVIGQTGAQQAVAIAGAVQELGGGLYNVSYTAQGGGRSCAATAVALSVSASTAAAEPQLSSISLTVTLEAADIPGSPFQVSILPAALVPSACVVQGAGQAVKGQLASFLIQPADEFGNPAVGAVDGGRFSVSVDGAQPASLQLQPLQSGAVLVSYLAPSLPSFSLAVSMDAQLLPQFPLTVQPLDSLLVSASLQLAVQSASAVVSLALLLSAGCVHRLRHQPVFKGASPMFLLLTLLGCQLCLVSGFVPAVSAPSDSAALCCAYSWPLSLGFTLAVSSLVAKTWRVARIFLGKRIVKRSITDRQLLLPVAAAVTAELLLNTAWLLLDPLRPTQFASSSNSLLQYAACASSHSTLWSALTFGPKAALLLYAVLLASQVRNVPSAFNESRWICLTVYNLAVCCALVLAAVFVFAATPASVFAVRGIVVAWCVAVTAGLLVGVKAGSLNASEPDWDTRSLAPERSPAVRNSTGLTAAAACSPKREPSALWSLRAHSPTAELQLTRAGPGSVDGRQAERAASPGRLLDGLLAQLAVQLRLLEAQARLSAAEQRPAAAAAPRSVWLDSVRSFAASSLQRLTDLVSAAGSEQPQQQQQQQPPLLTLPNQTSAAAD